MGVKKQQLIKKLNAKEELRSEASLWAKRTHAGKNHWHINKRTSVIVCKFCETKIPIWKNPKYCPNCLEGKEDK